MLHTRSLCLLLLACCAQPTNSQPSAAIHFIDCSAQSRLVARHHVRNFNQPKGEVLGLFATFGAAVAAGDYDNDGYDDLFVTDSAPDTPNHLFHNNHDGTFSDNAGAAGVAQGNTAHAFVTDALWFDYDNDGREDLVVARFGKPILYHNDGGGKFTDVSDRSGLSSFSNTVAVIAFDYDNDGYLDLLFANYFAPVDLTSLTDPHVLPNSFVNADNGGGIALWRNTGHGSFVDVTRKAGLAGWRGWALDVGHGDLSNNGLQDIYVAVDYGPDRLFLNKGDGTYADATPAAIGPDAKSGMNVEMADYDNDGWLDIFVTNITEKYMRQCNMLWRNNRDGTFTDFAQPTGTCDAGWAWAAKFADFDNDGWQDLFIVNGLHSAGPEEYAFIHPSTKPVADMSNLESWPELQGKSWNGFEHKKLFHNLRGESFRDISTEAGVDNTYDGRGVAVIDLDNDGKLDLVETNLDQPLIAYRNATAAAGNWLELKLSGTASNRDAIGARVRLTVEGRTQIREVNGGNGFAGQSTRTVHFGLGKSSHIDSLEVIWPSGLVESFKAPLNRVSRIEEGLGTKKPSAPIHDR